MMFFFFNDTATTEIYTLSLHDALPIYLTWVMAETDHHAAGSGSMSDDRDRKSTRLNSSHTVISYAVFCLKKKKNISTVRMQSNNLCTRCGETLGIKSAHFATALRMHDS